MPKKKKTGASKLHVNDGRLERDKRVAMWAGVIFFMVIVMVAWFFSFRRTVVLISRQSAERRARSAQALPVGDLGSIIKQTKDGVAGLSEQLRAPNSAYGSVRGSVQNAAPEEELLRAWQERVALEKFLFALSRRLQALRPQP